MTVNSVIHIKCPLCLLCRVVSQFHYNDLLPTCRGLVGHVASKSQGRNKLATSQSVGKLQGNVCDEFCV